ncbi:hypothetical protein FLM55_02735 [Francisella sp. Scap27]|uniref:Lipoprotein n=2 Tax=Francisellaceae TaxID=34064 RepID=A0A2Z4XX95_9GAMM|nr:hypothetical protein CDH04_03315 [Francisella adeliensis]QLE78716.1 hypothetical protein FLM55_02735 [Francisella sp. Scap27]MBK2084801.1 hypothetical protein [Francisella adeliensis]MBK2097256.1 hypothetical protein [Francisella adeliensis]QIW11732.1 hypothetical protein FZC43_03315 [Francisella adeliensis]
MTMKKTYQLILLAATCMILLASCGKSKQEIALQNLEQEQTNYSQDAKSEQLESETAKTNASNLDKESKESSSEAKYDEDKADVLEAKATQNLSKAASLNSEIDKAKVAAGEE